MYTLDNGVRLIFKPTTANNILAVSCFIDIGSAQELPEKSGLTNFTQTLLRKGTQKRTAEEIALELESLGASMGDETYEDFAEVSAVATVGDVEKIIELMADVLFQPTFPPEEIEKERRNILDEIRLSEDNSFYFTYKHFKRLLYGEQHPYGRPVEGTPETVARITRDDIVNFHKKYYLPSNMILSVVANIEEKKLLRLIKQYFPPESSSPPTKFLVDRRGKSRYNIEIKRKEVEQGFILLGYITCEVGDKDYLPLKVTSAILGEGMSSRLFVQLRDKLGLSLIHI
ncbi:MAG: insulinase family protein [Candidatus Sumerlaeia bacterium]|nr:insulinase family protein [Candidatus Sumerlaeia bacterium]